MQRWEVLWQEATLLWQEVLCPFEELQDLDFRPDRNLRPWRSIVRYCRCRTINRYCNSYQSSSILPRVPLSEIRLPAVHHRVRGYTCGDRRPEDGGGRPNQIQAFLRQLENCEGQQAVQLCFGEGRDDDEMRKRDYGGRDQPHQVGGGVFGLLSVFVRWGWKLARKIIVSGHHTANG